MEKNNGNLSDPPEYGRTGRILLDTLAEAILNFTIFIFRFVAWAFRWSVATAVMLAVMAAAGIFVFNQAVVGGEPVTVPNIQHMSTSEAESVLMGKGLVLGTASLVESNDVPANLILSQRPKAGEVVRAGRKVYPTVSRGVKRVDSPDVVNRTLTEAKDVLEKDGLKVPQPAYMPSTAPRDTVIAQDPPAGRPTDTGEIHLLVSSGSYSELIMPKLIGLPLTKVAAELSKLGLNGTPNRVSQPDAPFDVVLDQRPPAGSIINPGMTVEYDVRPSTEAKASQMLREVQVTYTVPDGYTKHKVWVQGIAKDGHNKMLMNEREVPGGSQISFPFRFTGEATVVFYVDGKKDRSYYYEGDSPPVVTTYIDWGDDTSAQP